MSKVYGVNLVLVDEVLKQLRFLLVLWIAVGITSDKDWTVVGQEEFIKKGVKHGQG